MAAGRQTRIRGPIRSLSPIFGKFRVKMNPVRSSRQVGSLRRNALQINQPARLELQSEASGRFHFFCLADRLRIPTMKVHKTPAVLAIGRLEKADSRDDVRR